MSTTYTREYYVAKLLFGSKLIKTWFIGNVFEKFNKNIWSGSL